MQRLQGVRVPESDVSVSCASSCRQEAVLVGGPADSFHSCCVLVELHKWFVRVQVPNHEFIIVSTGG